MSNFNEEKFLKDYTERYNKSKQGQAQSASVAVNGGFDEEKFLADYTKKWEVKKAADYAKYKSTMPTDTNQSKTQLQQQNYDRLQALFNRSSQKELENINRQINTISAYGAGADRSNLQSLLQKKDRLEAQLKVGRYDEDLSFADRLTLTAQGTGESYDAAAGVLVDTAVQAYKDHKTYKGDADYDSTRKGLAEVTRQISALQYKINNGFANQVDMEEYNRLLRQRAQLDGVMNEKFRTPMNMDSDAVKAMQRAMQAQQQATYGMGDTGKFLWNTGASIAENASLMPLAALPGGQAAITALLGARSAAQKAVEVGESGGSAGEALFRGMSSGLVEAATEKLPLDNLIKIAKGSTGRTIIKNILKQAGTEGGEEVVAYIANTIIDIAADDPDAKMSFADAFMSFLGGAISGGVMGGGAEVVGRNRTASDTDDGTKSAAGAASAQQTMENAVQVQPDVADTDDGNIAADNNVSSKKAENDTKSSKSAIKPSKIDTVSANNVIENVNNVVEVNNLQQSGNTEQLKKEMQQAAGIDTRTEVEKVAEEQQQYVDSVRELVETGVAPAEHLEQAQQKAEETIKEALNKQVNLDYQELDADSGRVRQEAMDSGVTAKSVNVQTKAENALIRTISNAFGVKYNDKQGIIKEMVKEISQQVKETGTVKTEDLNRLADAAFEKGVISSNELVKQYPNLKAELRDSRIKYQSSEVFQNMRNEYFGKLRFAKDGIDVDIVYQHFNEKYPDMFPEDITNPEDQVVRLGQIYDSLAENEQSLADYYGDSSEEMKTLIREDLQYAVDKYISELNEVESFEADNRRKNAEAKERQNRKPPTMAEYKAAQDAVYRAQKVVEKLERELLLEEKDKNLINTLLAGGDPETVKGPKREKILAMYAAKKAVQDARAPIKQYQADVRSKRNAMADDVLTTFRGWKDKINGLAFSTETFERNIRDIVPDKTEAQKIIDLYITPIHTAEANSVRLKNKMRDRVKALGINTGTKAEDLYEVEVYDKDKPYKLQVNESGLVQLYGEKKISKAQLQEVGADVAKIEKAVAEFRKIYEELYEMANDALLRNGYSPLGKIKDYFPHFTEENDTVLSRLAARAGFEVQTNRLPTSIAGITETFKPGKRWWSNMQHRTGETTLFDAVTGFDQYIEGVTGIINQTDNIQNLRSLENRLRYLSSDKGVKDEMNRIDTLDIRDTEKQDLKDKLFADMKDSNLSNFVTYLRDYTNNLAGKKDFSDRQIEHDFGRGVYTVSKALESRIASNMIGGNIGSALTNFIPIAQATGEVKSKHLLQAMNDTMRAMYGHDNGFEVESDFLTNRFGSDKLVYTLAQRMSNKAGYLMNICDRFTSNVVTRAKYLQNIENGMDPDSALANANSFAAGLLADRSKGAVPLVFERKNPLLKAVTMFQVEQNNQLRYLIKDLPKGLEKEGIKALTAAILKYSIASWMYNLAYQFIVGRKPAFDPIDIGFGLVSDAVSVAKGEMKTSAALTNAATTVAEELPFISGLVGGGRVPISSALPDAAEVVKLLDADVSAEKKKSIATKELTKPLWYLAAPTGGGQAKKVAEAAALYFLNGGVEYGVEADGDKKAKFAVDTNNVLKAGQTALFGKWSSKEAREYIDNNFKGLTVGQTENFEIFKSWGMSNSEAFDKAKGTSAMTDKQLETLQQLQEAGMKNSTAYEMATTAKASADKDGNGSIKTEEAKAYLNSKNFTREQKAILFSCMCPNVKNNPYE